MPSAGRFPEESVQEALERALRNAKHLKSVHAPAIAVMRSLAWKLDNWDTLAEIAIRESEEFGCKPRVPQNDNVTAATFLKYCAALGLTFDQASAEPRPKTEPQTKPAKPSNKIVQFRQRA